MFKYSQEIKKRIPYCPAPSIRQSRSSPKASANPKIALSSFKQNVT